MTDSSTCCVLCPAGRDRIPDRSPVCEACRAWLASIITDLRILTAELEAVEDLVPDLRPAPQADPDHLKKTGQRIAWRDLDGKLMLRPRDPVAAMVPSGSAGVKTGIGRVSGTSEPAVPIRVDVVDILARARQASRYLFARGEYALGADPDQVGHLSLATVLDTWVRDWAARLGHHQLPHARVDPMCDWLIQRVDWACSRHPRIEDFAAEVREYRSTLRGLLGLVDVPDHKTGVACPRCDNRTLYQWHGGARDGSLWIECGSCPAIMSPTEYSEWVTESARHLA